MKTKTADLYKATYLLVNGGKLLKYRRTPLTNKKALAKGFKFIWKLVIQIDDKTLLDKWDNNEAYTEANEFSRMRKELKKILYRDANKWKQPYGNSRKY